MTLHERHLNNVWNAAFRKEARAAGRKLTGGPNACAATASQYYIALGILDKPILWAQALADYLAADKRFTRIPVADIQPGDLIVCVDANGNHASDHVFHNYGPLYPAKTGHPTHAGWTWAVDNHQDRPYPRDLVAQGGYTDAAYALRLTV